MYRVSSCRRWDWTWRSFGGQLQWNLGHGVRRWFRQHHRFCRLPVARIRVTGKNPYHYGYSVCSIGYSWVHALWNTYIYSTKAELCEYNLWTYDVNFAVPACYVQCDLFDCYIFDYEIIPATFANALLFTAALCYASSALAVMRWLYVCVCVSVTFVHCVKTNKHIFNKFSPHHSSFSVPNGMAIFRRELPWRGRRMQVK